MRAMKDSDARAFATLFQDACQKCFSAAPTAPLTESESHHLSVEITEATGLEIGWKSLKNYSHFLLGRQPGKPENPSNATLEALARYVAGAPATADSALSQGKRDHPYWFRYKKAAREPDSGDSLDSGRPREHPWRRPAVGAAVALGVALVALLLVTVRGRFTARAGTFTDPFDDVTADGLARRGWRLQWPDTVHWAERGANSGYLTLFTLKGDNWPQPGTAPRIPNLLVRRAPADCFVAELRLSGFLPTEDWQQAGLLLLEDTAFAGRSLRLSLGFNDFAGGFPATKEVIVQAITSLGSGFSKPVDPGSEALVRENLAGAALRIEKRGTRFRLLYSAGPMKNAAFKEVASTDFDMRPAYVAIFALRGFVSDADAMPVLVDAFSVSRSQCGR
jgi:hypothetical protein